MSKRDKAVNTIPCTTKDCGADCDQAQSVVYCFKCWDAAGRPRPTDTGNGQAAFDRVRIEWLESQLAAHEDAICVLAQECAAWRAEGSHQFTDDPDSQAATRGFELVTDRCKARIDTDANSIAAAAIKLAK